MAVDDGVMSQQRHAQHVHVAVLERAGLVVVDLAVARAAAARPPGSRLRAAGRGSGAGASRASASSGAVLREIGARRRQVERLDHEARELARARRAVVGRRRQHQLVHGARHRHVEEPPLLEQVAATARSSSSLASSLGKPERLAVPLQRELRLGAADQEHHRELEPLGLVHGQHVHGVLVELRLGDRRVVAGLAQQLEVRDERRHAVVLGHVAVGLHGVEEARDVPDLRLALGARLLREPREQPRRTAGSRRAPRRCAGAAPRRPRARRRRSGARPPRARAAETEASSSFAGSSRNTSSSGRVLRARVVVEAQQVGLGQPVELRGREVEERHRVVRVREHASGTRPAGGSPRARRARGCR